MQDRRSTGGLRIHTAGGAALVLAAALFGQWGCGPRLPTYPWAGAGAALDRLVERGSAIRTISATGDLVLTGADGRSVQLRAALVAKRPACIRLRAWKLSQTVLDITACEGRTWIYQPQRQDALEAPRPGAQDVPVERAAQHVRELWPLLFDPFSTGKWEEVTGGTSGALMLARTVGDGGSMTCTLDRATLTPRRVEMRESGGRLLATLTLDRYVLAEGTPWPTRIRAEHDGHELLLLLDDVELNAELPEGAFVPPPAATDVPLSEWRAGQ